MNKLRIMHNKLIYIIALVAATAAFANAQEITKEPKSGLTYNDYVLSECIMNIDGFEKGFYWVDLKGNSWWVLPNPIHRIGDTNLLQVHAFLYYDVRALAEQEKWKVYYSLDEYYDDLKPDANHPPVFLERNKSSQSVH